MSIRVSTYFIQTPSGQLTDSSRQNATKPARYAQNPARYANTYFVCVPALRRKPLAKLECRTDSSLLRSCKRSGSLVQVAEKEKKRECRTVKNRIIDSSVWGLSEVSLRSRPPTRPLFLSRTPKQQRTERAFNSESKSCSSGWVEYMLAEKRRDPVEGTPFPLSVSPVALLDLLVQDGQWYEVMSNDRSRSWRWLFLPSKFC